HALEDPAIDRLVRRGAPLRRIELPRYRAERRGTGCALASAIAAQLAAGAELEEACRRAKRYVAEGLLAAASR
ncbi:MAG: bifunctional hydroxymethylpyrimidine kinase/phosphomethylpyrimidine kinase, partial [Steroidobacteraceae bacterium]